MGTKKKKNYKNLSARRKKQLCKRVAEQNFDDDLDYDLDFDDEDFDEAEYDEEYDEDYDEEEDDWSDMSEFDAEMLRDAIHEATRERRKLLSQPDPKSLVGKCLVHIGETNNELYRKSVIYITECSKEMVRGIMINKLLLGTATLECKNKQNETVLKNVYEDLYQGGPVNPAHGFVLFPTEEDTADDPFADILGDISVSTSFGVLQEILDGEGPSKKIIAMGHCVWHRGELEWEIFNNQWLIVPSSPKLMFDTKFEDRWEYAKRESGILGGAFISHIGLA